MADENQVDALSQLLKTFKENNLGSNETKIINITYSHEGEERPVCSIFVDEKYISFHDEFDQIGIDLPGMSEFMKTAIGWEFGHS